MHAFFIHLSWRTLLRAQVVSRPRIGVSGAGNGVEKMQWSGLVCWARTRYPRTTWGEEVYGRFLSRKSNNFIMK